MITAILVSLWSSHHLPTEPVVLPPAQQQKKWDYAADFNIKRHGERNGVWEYGYYDKGTYNFNFFNGQIEQWHDVQNLFAMFRKGPDWNMVHLAKNVSANLIDLEPTLKWHGFDCSAHPGAGGELAVITFVAPRAAKYQLTFNISGLDEMATTKCQLVLDHKTLLENHDIKGEGYKKDAKSWKEPNYLIDLSAGQKLSFAISDAGNTNKSDSTKIELLITDLTP